MSASMAISQLERETTSKIRWRIFPFMMIGMIFCFLDRVNIGFAALQMNADLGLSAAAFGFASGIFFIGYFLLEVPSNLVMARVGPRVWLTRIMFTWGVIAMGTAFVRDANQLYIVRFLLGIAEAGFFPGLVLYSTIWFRGREHAQAVSWILFGSYTASTIGGPLSGYLLGVNGFGMVGWQWLFVMEGLMPVLFGFVILAFWTNRPEEAMWLKPEEREWIVKAIAEENAAKETPKDLTLWQILSRPRTLVLFLCYFMQGVGNLAIQFWMPQIVKSAGPSLSSMGVGLLTMLPNISIILALLLWSRHSDLTGERHWHIVGALAVAAVGFYLIPFATVIPIVVFALCLASAGMGGAQATFWGACTKLLGPKEAAAGLALINSGAALGGFVGPYITGWAKDLTGDYFLGMMILATDVVVLAVILHTFFVKVEGREAKAKFVTS